MTTVPFLSTAEAAAHLGLTPRTLASWREKSINRGPRFYRVGLRKVGYDAADLDAWIKARAVETKGN